jgi:hypothetical protein
MSSNKIYIVAGERNIKLAQLESGLWANVGQTSRDVSDRLRDDDYKRKAAGGKWQILFTQDVGENLTDKQIHPFLKQHPDVEWDRNSDNTEEFLFKEDPGDGSVARRIVGEILRRVCLPILQDENAKLQDEVSRLQLELQDSNETVASLLSEDAIRESLARQNKLEDVNKQILESLKQTEKLLKEAKHSAQILREEYGKKYKELFEENELISNDKLKMIKDNELRSQATWSFNKKFVFIGYGALLAFGVLIGQGWESSNWHENLDPVIGSSDYSDEQLATMINAFRNNTLSIVSENKALGEQLIKLNQLNSTQSKHTLEVAPNTLTDTNNYDFADNLKSGQSISCISLGEETDHNWARTAHGPWYTNCKTRTEILRLYGDAFTGPKAGAKVKINKHGNNYIASFKHGVRAVIVTDGNGNLK